MLKDQQFYLITRKDNLFMSNQELPLKFTKIVATLGPATETEEVLEQLMLAGMNVARFNCKHSVPEWHKKVIARVKKVAKKLNKSVAVLVDLQGPEIRINMPDEESVPVKIGDTFIFTSDRENSAKKKAFIPQNVIDDLSKGDKVSVDDGACEMEVIKKGAKYVQVKILSDHTIKHRKTLNTPGVTMNMPSLIDRDFDLLNALEDGDADYIALSFVRNRKDIQILRQEMAKRGLHAAVMPKIECQAALDNLDEIIAEADALMIARGDLGVEVPFEQLVFWQKIMIDKCRTAGKPVITATQMLMSMVEKPTPTRAEVSDIAHAIYDKTDAVMLSEETTIGKYPVKCVATQAKIAAFNEKYTDTDLADFLMGPEKEELSILDAAVYMLASDSAKIDAVICLTETGATAARILRSRPKIPVYVLTGKKTTYQKMALYYAAEPCMVDFSKIDIESAKELLKKIRQYDFVKKGQKVMLIHGGKWGVSGGTDTISLVTI